MKKFLLFALFVMIFGGETIFDNLSYPDKFLTSKQLKERQKILSDIKEKKWDNKFVYTQCGYGAIKRNNK